MGYFWTLFNTNTSKVLEVFGTKYDIIKLYERVNFATQYYNPASKSQSDMIQSEFEAFKRQKIFDKNLVGRYVITIIIYDVDMYH